MKINTPRFLVLHHIGGTSSNPSFDSSVNTFEQVNRYHKGKWHFKSSLGYYIAYQYFIDWSGKLAQGRADTDIGAHVIGMNDKSIGICLAGNFDRIGEHNRPSEAQVIALKQLLRHLMLKYDIPVTKVVGHRFFSQTACPGRNFNDVDIRLLASKAIATDEAEKIELLKKQIGIIQKLIALYTKILRLFKNKVGGKDKEDN